MVDDQIHVGTHCPESPDAPEAAMNVRPRQLAFLKHQGEQLLDEDMVWRSGWRHWLNVPRAP